tara:strand:+ start:2036 stop:2488 length:453 start_codon:yes stop_codon:yes gene_type:complete
VAGFIFAYNISGGRPLIYEFTMKDTETLTVGDLLNLESNEVDLAATNDAAMLGPLQGAADPDDNVTGKPGSISGTDSTTKVRAIVNADAVLSDDSDANARLVGDPLDVGGATGAQGVAANSNTDFFILKDSAASENTLVKIANGEHWLNQ